ncbi:MAG: hypothetical protein JXM69_14225 [Anaerolineae bacterium]|nr:hypothetical protein [Anaerolineae bacterium]
MNTKKMPSVGNRGRDVDGTKNFNGNCRYYSMPSHCMQYRPAEFLATFWGEFNYSQAFFDTLKGVNLAAFLGNSAPPLLIVLLLTNRLFEYRKRQRWEVLP